MGANHTFNANAAGGCDDDTRNPSTAFEVGSGITVMGYAGICGSEGLTDSQDLDKTSIAFMHAYIIKEITDYASMACFVSPSGSTINHPPQVFAPQMFTVLANTPFLLTGFATDPEAQDQANLTYSWEPLDLGAPSPPDNDDGTRPCSGTTRLWIRQRATFHPPPSSSTTSTCLRPVARRSRTRW
jgi:hypothetical protein